MTQEPMAPSAPFVNELPEIMTDTMTRLNLTMPQMSEYWGVPVPTLKKWRQGTRYPTSAALRLIEVLQMIETLAPDIHRAMVPTKKEK